MPNLHFLEAAARRKLSEPEVWEAYRYESETGGYVVEGSVPYGRTKNGRPKWRKDEGRKVILSEADVDAEIRNYVQATGNCPNCLGTKEEFESWSATEGTKKRPCRDCGATGKAGGRLQ